MAAEAKDRGLYRYAVLTAARAAEAADTSAIIFVARLLSEARRVEECISWLRPFAKGGDAEAMLRLAAELPKSEQENRYEERLSWLERVAESGNSRAMWELVNLFGTRRMASQIPELAEKAIGWLRQLADGDDPRAIRHLAELLDDMGRIDEAAYWVARLPESIIKRLESREHQAELAAAAREMLGPWESEPYPRPEDEASIPALRSRAIAGDLRAMERLAGLLDEAGETAEAKEWLRRAAEAGQDTAAWNLAEILHRAGRVEEALATIQQAAGYWDDSLIAFELVMPWLRKVGGQSSLQSFLESAGNAGNGWAAAYLGRELARNGQTAEANRWLRPSAENGNPAAMELLGLFFDQAGQVTEAGAWYRRVDQTASPFLLFALASILQNGGWPDRAIIRYRNAIECKRTDAMNPLAELLVRMGRTEEAKRLKAFGIEPGGPTAQPWRAPTRASRSQPWHAQNDHIGVPQPMIAEEPATVQIGGSVRVLLDLPCRSA